MTKILIIEDDENLQENVASILSFEGFDTAQAMDGVEGLALAQTYQPDVIICDIMMPRMGGYDVLQHIRNDKKLGAVPFLFLTAKVGRNDMRQGMELGANDYLPKPFTSQELLRAIEGILNKHKIVTSRYQEKVKQLQQSMTLSLPHEFRTPLSLIMGYTSYLLESPDEIQKDELVLALKDIYQSSLRLQRLIENHVLYAQLEGNLLDAESVQKAAQYLKNSPTQSDYVLEEIAFGVAQKHKRNNDLRVNLVSAPITIMTEYLSKISEEIIDNAFKFSDTGSLVEINSQIVDQNLEIRVRDNGYGMADTEIEQIEGFVQFNRDENEQQGMGLGLSLATRLVELHSGRFMLTSEVGKGTTITIVLPL